MCAASKSLNSNCLCELACIHVFFTHVLCCACKTLRQTDRETHILVSFPLQMPLRLGRSSPLSVLGNTEYQPTCSRNSNKVYCLCSLKDKQKWVMYCNNAGVRKTRRKLQSIIVKTQLTRAHCHVWILRVEWKINSQKLLII